MPQSLANAADAARNIIMSNRSKLELLLLRFRHHRHHLKALAKPQKGALQQLLPDICTGKDTYFSASYWHHVAATLDKEIAKYFQRGT